jgi:hypothetical protein
MNTYVNLWQSLAEFFLEIKQTKGVRKLKTYILCSTNFSETLTIYGVNVEKHGTTGQARKYATCMQDN